MSYIIETRDLTRKFGSFTAVDNISFGVDKGEIFGLLGPNGAGKSTTLSMLCTILRPTSGTALVSGYDVVRQPSQVRKSIGIVFQDPSIDDKLTGRENLVMHGDLYGVPRGQMKGRIDDVLKLVELEDRADDYMSTYSSGMRRRLEIARSLIHYPRVLFLDEPTIGLDPQSRDHIWSYIRELIKKEDITIILTTHYMDEADKLCNRIAIVDHGKIVAMDTPQRLKEQLGGESIIVKTSDNPLYAEKIMESGLAKGVATADGEVRITVDSAHTALPKVVDVAGKAGIYIDSVSIKERQLDDVFMHYTGRALRQGGKELTGMGRIMRRMHR
jgi:ABC-2 type transport system ATP-binding protein